MAELAHSSAAQASPGAYGTPVDPSLPNPTEVATDPPAPQPTSGSVSVVLTFADWDADSSTIEAGAFVQGLVESGGTCTITAARSGSTSGTATASVPGEPDVSSTTCPALSLSGNLTSGSWTVQVQYTSETSSGTSSPTTVVIP